MSVLKIRLDASPPHAMTMLPSPASSFHDHEFAEICSIASSSNETEDDLPGLGRTLGNIYSFLGNRLETALATIAVRTGHGPGATFMEIKRIDSDKLLPEYVRCRKIRMMYSRLARYAK